jgi:hypothetical protein
LGLLDWRPVQLLGGGGDPLQCFMNLWY